MIRHLVLVMCLFAASAWAQQSQDSYRIEAKVANQSEAERIAAAKANMGEVIQRITGDASSLQHPLVRQAISDAPNYLAKFNYPTDTSIVLNFSPQAVQKLLVDAQLIAAAKSNSQSVKLYVVNAADFATFKQVQSYLKTIGVIRRVELTSVNKEMIEFTLNLDGDAEQLKSTLSVANRLQLLAGDVASPLSFRWQN